KKIFDVAVGGTGTIGGVAAKKLKTKRVTKRWRKWWKQKFDRWQTDRNNECAFTAQQKKVKKI
ncbi:hypothetical protein, partial [Flavobacterium columnare]|uniref:hypothetical protein n=1 Tax=Flavobacterium columnare TaxID=996 RepID=UPI00298A04CF